MVHLGKIYTKTGDAGTTGLVGGGRIEKTALRLEAYGTTDELNALIGIIRTVGAEHAVEAIRGEAETVLRRIQNDLFDVGSLLATPPGAEWEGMRELRDDQVVFLEEQMDRYQEILEPLSSFTLPGGSLVNAHAHLARTVCRRAERILWRLHEEEPVAEVILRYINRLSDYLFVFSRWSAATESAPEYLWDSEISRGEG